MPNNLPLAVEIAEIAPRVGVSDVAVKAQDLTARHPEAQARVEDVADALRDIGRSDSRPENIE